MNLEDLESDFSLKSDTDTESKGGRRKRSQTKQKDLVT